MLYRYTYICVTHVNSWQRYGEYGWIVIYLCTYEECQTIYLILGGSRRPTEWTGRTGFFSRKLTEHNSINEISIKSYRKDKKVRGRKIIEPTRCHNNMMFISWLINSQHVSGIVIPETCWELINQEINIILLWHLGGSIIYLLKWRTVIRT